MLKRKNEDDDMGTSNTTSSVPNVAHQNTRKQKLSVNNSNNKNEMGQYLQPIHQNNIVQGTKNSAEVFDNKKRSSVHTNDILDGKRTLRHIQGDMTNNFDNKKEY